MIQGHRAPPPEGPRPVKNPPPPPLWVWWWWFADKVQCCFQPSMITSTYYVSVSGNPTTCKP